MAGEEEEGGPPNFFTLHLDKPLPCQVEMAAWNPVKDLLAMVMKDQQLTVHRFNWQRLWAVSPESKVTSLCWRPDGKELAIGHEDGSIFLHDVENGDVVRRTLTHSSPVDCLSWVGEEQETMDQTDELFLYEDRTPRFFPPPPKPPQMPGTKSNLGLSGILGATSESDGSTEPKTHLSSFQNRINILCSADRDGVIWLNVFGMFPICKLKLRNLDLKYHVGETSQLEKCTGRLQDVSVLKVSLSSNFRKILVLCHGQMTAESETVKGLYCLCINSTLLGDRRKELRQLALQASNIMDHLDVLEKTIVVMQKHWSDAITSFNEKFQILAGFLREHGSQGSPRDELLSLLSCGSASSAVHQFLAGYLDEAGLKRLGKTIDSAGRELHALIAEYLQPAAEVLAFRIGELRGLSRWRSRFSCIGLDEKFMDLAMEDAGMVLVQVERLLRIVSDSAGQFRLFFVWLIKSLKQLNNEASSQADQQHLPAINSEDVATFLKTQFNKDTVGPHLEPASSHVILDLDIEELQRFEELAVMGGFLDCKFFQRTLAQQIHQLGTRCQKAFSLPTEIISPELYVQEAFLLCQGPLPAERRWPLSIANYEGKHKFSSKGELHPLLGYMCFQMPIQDSSSDHCVIGVVRGETLQSMTGEGSLEILALRIQQGFNCIDISLYKEKQLVLLLSSTTEPMDKDSSRQAWLMVLQTEHLPFAKVPSSYLQKQDLWNPCLSSGSVVDVGLQDGKARLVCHPDAISPLAVSASRGLACVFAGQRRAVLYDLEEDEHAEDDDNDDDEEMS